MRTTFLAAAVLLLVPSLAWPCSLAQRPTNVETLAGAAIPSRLDGGSDAVPPAKPVLSAVQVTLVRNPCDGRGFACPQIDSLQMTVSVGDDQTPVERLRYVAFIAGTAQEAASVVSPELLFEADFDSPTTLSAWLGVGRQRREAGFDRTTLCFAVAAVDEAANVGERSDVTCLATTDEAAATTTVMAGSPCVTGCAGCSGVGGGVPLVLLALGALLRRRR